MKLKFFFKTLLVMSFLPVLCSAQSTKFEISPFVYATSSIKDGIIEAGPEISNEKKSLIIRPTVRMPLTNKADNVLQIDRFSSTARGVVAVEWIKDNVTANSGISRHSFTGQAEWGFANFKYYPTGRDENEVKSRESSYAFEAKYVGFSSKGGEGEKQYSPQFRLRYSYDWKPSKEVGVVNTVNENGVITTKDVVIDAPSVRPTFSPAFSLQYYPGKGSFSYSPAIYYDLTGEKGENNPFTNLGRLRVEAWTFFYPTVTGSSNTKIGISPFISVRTHGTDDFNKVEFGGILTIRFGTSFLQFL